MIVKGLSEMRELDPMIHGNPYDWQFAIRGPNGTEFEGGIYHGRIQFPEEYPKKPPIFTLLTCDLANVLLLLAVRDALHRLIGLLPTYPDGALGSVEYDKEERRALAIKSREAAPRYGTAERQKLIDEIHKYMLSMVPPVPSNKEGDVRLSFQNDRDRRKQDMVTQKRKRNEGNNFFIGNRIKADNCERVGFFEFGKRLQSLWRWYTLFICF
ncbi:hypothetical protein ACE6H2_016504 [Prunus campanulata]